MYYVHGICHVCGICYQMLTSASVPHVVVSKLNKLKLVKGILCKYCVITTAEREADLNKTYT